MEREIYPLTSLCTEKFEMLRVMLLVTDENKYGAVLLCTTWSTFQVYINGIDSSYHSFDCRCTLRAQCPGERLRSSL
jgi:hypothetical protein